MTTTTSFLKLGKEQQNGFKKFVNSDKALVRRDDDGDF